jgi:hypothetical protein
MVSCEKKELTEVSGLAYSLTTRSTGFANKELLFGLFHEIAKGRRDTDGHAPRY